MAIALLWTHTHSFHRPLVCPSYFFFCFLFFFSFSGSLSLSHSDFDLFDITEAIPSRTAAHARPELLLAPSTAPYIYEDMCVG